MKQILYSVIWLLALQVTMTACQDEDSELGTTPEAADASFTHTPTTENKNIIQFTSPSDAFLKKWSFGNGVTAEGNNPKATFPVKGSYEVTLTVYTSGGSTSSKQTVVIAETDPTLLDIPVYNLLTGGNGKPEGKTWVVDKNTLGHLGIGPATGDWPEWYSAKPGEKEGKNLYDDEMTFKLAGFSFQYVSNGTIYVNAAFGNVFPNSVVEPGGADFFAPYTPPTNMTWSLAEVSKDKWQLTINGGGQLGYYSGSSTYEIIALGENELYVRNLQGGTPANAWYQRFVPKGYTPPVVPPKEKPYAVKDIEQNFDGQGTAVFIGDSQGSLATYDNPAPVPINTSAKVGKYTKADGQAGEYANVQLTTDYRLDLTKRHIFKMKVFIPSYNDYTKIGAEDWQAYKTLQKQVSMKLQNSLKGGDAYMTQAEIKHTDLATDKWVELTFDFSAVADRTDFDRVVIQIGGEAIFTGGIFFYDDLQLLPE